MIHSNGPDASYGNIQASCDTQDRPNSIAPVTLHGTDISRTPSQVHTRREWTAYELYAFVLERQTLMGVNGHPVPSSIWGKNIDSRDCPDELRGTIQRYKERTAKMWNGQAMTEAYGTVVGEQPDSEDGEDLSEALENAPYNLLGSLHDSLRKEWTSKGGLPAGTDSTSAVAGPGASPAVSAPNLKG